MAKYIVASKLAGWTTKEQRRKARKEFDDSFEAMAEGSKKLSVVGERAPARDRRRTIVLESDPTEIEKLKSKASADVLVEEAIEHHKADEVPFDLLQAGPLDLASMLRAEVLVPQAAGIGQELKVEVYGRRQRLEPLNGAEVHAFLAGPGDLREHMVSRTNKQGETKLSFAPFYEILSVLIIPYSDFWPKVVRGGSSRRLLKVTCDPLPSGGPGAWWHSAMGIRADAANGQMIATGEPMRVGVIDSGCGPNPGVAHVKNEGAFIDGDFDSNGGGDSGSHGTHVAGTIGTRIGGHTVPFQGVAPGVDLFTARVFPENGGANQGDIADALDHLVDVCKVHLVNMSLGSTDASKILLDAIRAATEQGVLCVCAAGNAAGPVSYPARFRETIAVSALGRLGKVPLDSLHALPNDQDRFGSEQLYLADFSNFGNEVDIAAPGVGLVAPVPSRFGYDDAYAAMNGTSMASPAACGAIAVLLANDPLYGELDASSNRARYAKALLTAHCKSKLAERSLEGRGIPFVE